MNQRQNDNKHGCHWIYTGNGNILTFDLIHFHLWLAMESFKNIHEKMINENNPAQKQIVCRLCAECTFAFE